MGSGDSRCPRCDAALPSEARFCPACGFAATRLAAGDVLDGKYEILGKLAEGGMGEVFRARHVHLDEIRVIKVTKPDPVGEGPEPRRFQDEARLATLVRHPNVAALYDFSRLPDGSFYMVWEFIDGVTLEEWLRRHGPMSAARAIRVAKQVLSGLSEIHAQGIVHRDLSPDNVMLREGANGRLQAKIIDLGVAKRVASESLARTGTGLFLGKLRYCSPEQAGSLTRGEALDGRSDLYSFGVVLYEMLSGRTPFEAPTPEAYLGMHLHTPAPPLDTSKLPRDVGPELAAVVRKALQKNRDRRFRDAEEFRLALEAIEPAATAAEEKAAPLPPSGRRAARVWTGGVTAVLLLAAGLVAYWIVHRPAPRAPAGDFPLPTAFPTPAAPLAPTEGGLALPATSSATPTRSGAPAERSRGSSRGVANPSEAGAAPGPTAPPAATAPAATPAPAEAGESLPDVPDRMDEEGARRFQRFLKRWRTLTPERQSSEARLVARLANRFVAAYPDDPLAGELRQRLPGTFGSRARQELEAGRPRIALRYYEAYRELDFAPRDAALDRLFAGVRPTPD